MICDFFTEDCYNYTSEFVMIDLLPAKTHDTADHSIAVRLTEDRTQCNRTINSGTINITTIVTLFVEMQAYEPANMTGAPQHPN